MHGRRAAYVQLLRGDRAGPRFGSMHGLPRVGSGDRYVPDLRWLRTHGTHQPLPALRGQGPREPALVVRQRQRASAAVFNRQTLITGEEPLLALSPLFENASFARDASGGHERDPIVLVAARAALEVRAQPHVVVERPLGQEQRPGDGVAQAGMPRVAKNFSKIDRAGKGYVTVDEIKAAMASIM